MGEMLARGGLTNLSSFAHLYSDSILLPRFATAGLSQGGRSGGLQGVATVEFTYVILISNQPHSDEEHQNEGARYDRRTND
jgi:hypothetical protein